MAPHSSILAWKIPWAEEPGALRSMVSLEVGHDWAASLSLFTFMHWRRKWQPTPVFLPGESQGWGSLGAAFYGVAQSWTWLPWLNSSSRKWQPTPVFLLGKSHGHRNLLGYSPWSHKESDMTAQLSTHTHKSGSEIKGKIIKSYCQLKIKLLRNTSVKPLEWFSNYIILICMNLFRSLHQKLAICVPQVKSCSLSDFL